MSHDNRRGGGPPDGVEDEKKLKLASALAKAAIQKLNLPVMNLELITGKASYALCPPGIRGDVESSVEVLKRYLSEAMAVAEQKAASVSFSKEMVQMAVAKAKKQEGLILSVMKSIEMAG